MKIGDICTYAIKSKIKAGEAQINGEYMFFTSSSDESKRYSDYQLDCEGIIMGTGGEATLHYYNGKFATSTDCVVLLPDDKVRCKYLYYFLMSHMDVLNAGFKGAGLKHTNKRYISSIEIGDIPSLNIQDDIIRVLDKIKSVLINRQIEFYLFENLIKARFVEMFCDDTISDKWPYMSIENIALAARTGPFGSALRHNEFVDSGVFVLGIDNAVENKFSYNRMRYITEEKYQQLKRYTVSPGDVIITIMGTVGKSAVIPENMPKAINTKHLACITPDKTKVNPYFLSCAFQIHPEIRAQLQNQTKGAIMSGLNLKIIKGLHFAVPPITLQDEFVDFYNQIENLKSTIQKSLDETQLLFDSLMQKYFG